LALKGFAVWTGLKRLEDESRPDGSLVRRVSIASAATSSATAASGKNEEALAGKD
jgi:hypothetical protein